MIWDEILAYLDFFQRDILLLLGILISIPFKRSREFMRNWGPFLLLWICYDMMRGIADDLGKVHIREVYELELLLFGWMFDGKIPAFWWLDHQTLFLSSFTAFIYTLHPMIPLWLAIGIYYISKDIETFKVYSYSFLMTTYMALLTFVLYPVAPPWYVTQRGFNQPEQRTSLKESAAGLVNMDNFLRTDFYGTFYGTFNANPFAAMPSLHSAFSVISAYFAIYKYREKSKLVYLSVLYPMSVWFSAVYLQHHYIVDLIAGGLYVMISVKFVTWYRSKYVNVELLPEEDEPSEDRGKSDEFDSEAVDGPILSDNPID